MEDLLKDPVFYWLVWGIFTVTGIIIGWSLRASFPEKEVKRSLERAEQERNTLARLYTHIKYQHDLREADFKRATLEASTLANQINAMELEWAQNQMIERNHSQRATQAEANAILIAQKLQALQLQMQALISQNAQLKAELDQAKRDLDAWGVIYRDFQIMQQKWSELDKNSRALNVERDMLRQEVEVARVEIENLQMELVLQRSKQQETPLSGRQTNSKADTDGGPAAPEQNDDLKVINGITPLIEQQLFALGILQFEQISRWDDDAIIAFSKSLGISPGKIFQDDWVGQARYLLGLRR